MSVRVRRLGVHWAVSFVVAVVLASCAGPSVRPDQLAGMQSQQAREARLRLASDWTLQGRVAISDGRNGGSGSVVWENAPARSAFELRAPVTRQGWRLQVDEHGASLQGLEGGTRYGRNAETLVREALHWELPLHDLAAWVRGARGRGRARIEFDGDGLPLLIEQRGWRIEYRGWDLQHTPPLPRRVFATRGEHRVKLAISEWSQRPEAPP